LNIAWLCALIYICCLSGCRSHKWNGISFHLYVRSSSNRRPAALWIRIWKWL